MAVGDDWTIKFPGATPLRWHGNLSGLLVDPELIMLHTIVGTVESHVNHGGGADHLPIDAEGHVYQVQDLALRGSAARDANPRAIYLETEDVGPAFGFWPKVCGRVPGWTPAQIESLVAVLAWLCIRFDIPPVLVTRARPGQKGITYHRVGCPPGPEWDPGDELWTFSQGKCCPDIARIQQLINIIIPRVQALVEGEEMSQAQLNRIEEKLDNLTKAFIEPAGTTALSNAVVQVRAIARRVEARVNKLPTSTASVKQIVAGVVNGVVARLPKVPSADAVINRLKSRL